MEDIIGSPDQIIENKTRTPEENIQALGPTLYYGSPDEIYQHFSLHLYNQSPGTRSCEKNARKYRST